MKKDFTQATIDRAGRRTEKYLGWVLSTDIGRVLWREFIASGGQMLVDPYIDARAMYSPYTNITSVSLRATPSDIVHELGHARQWRKIPELALRNDLCIRSQIHLTAVMESDAWAMSSIFNKQFLRMHKNDSETLADYMKAERNYLIHSRDVTPVKIEGNRRVQSALAMNMGVFVDYMSYLNAGHERNPALDEMADAVIDAERDHEWAMDTYKRSFLGTHFIGAKANIGQYGMANILKGAIKNARPGVKEIAPPEMLEIIRVWADLSDLGMARSYIAGDNDLAWCLDTSHLWGQVKAGVHDFMNDIAKDFVASMPPSNTFFCSGPVTP